jgi:hypothetical protein
MRVAPRLCKSQKAVIEIVLSFPDDRRTSELPPACAGGFLRVPGDRGDPQTCLSQITGELPVARPQGIL